MKTESLVKLARMFEQIRDEEVENTLKWSRTKGNKTTDRDKAAIEAGFHAGWYAATNMVTLHNLK